MTVLLAGFAFGALLAALAAKPCEMLLRAERRALLRALAEKRSAFLTVLRREQ